ncbi:MAG: 5-formyltetrahydrofolate cyclo-ligase [Paracoccaceae bacterium]
MRRRLRGALRRALFARRSVAHATKDDRAPAANARLTALIGAPAGSIVAGYRPIRTEIDPTPTMSALHALGARLCVPVVVAPGEPLNFREWRPDAPMAAGPFGAEIPTEGEWLVPDVLIAPLLGWDRRGGRLGYGGGFYDRTLAQLRARGGARAGRAIGFAYAAQEAPETPAGPFDQRLNAVVTENEVMEVAV